MEGRGEKERGRVRERERERERERGRKGWREGKYYHNNIIIYTQEKQSQTHSDDSDGLAGIVDIEVVYGSGEGDGEKVGVLPETADLLVLHLRAHLELPVNKSVSQ